MEQKKTADHPASDRPRSPATEARIKEKNRRILMTVSLFVFLAAEGDNSHSHSSDRRRENYGSGSK